VLKKTVFGLLFIALALLALTGCSNRNGTVPTPVYLIVIDTLRTDALSTYGGKWPTPFLDEFAAQGVVFENCIAPSSWTVPSTASLLTGLYPFHHGTVKALQESGHVLSQQTLSSGWKTVAEYFKQMEYKTYGVSGNGHLAEQYGFTQGFDEFVTHDFKGMDSVTSSWSGMAAKIAGEYRFGSPFFAFLFYFDPHHPYVPREPYISKYYPNYLEPSQALLGKDMVQMWRDGYFKQHPKAVVVARAMYDSEVAALDAHLRDVFNQLPGFDDALVILTSDHGEEFFEHEQMIHGNNLMQTQIHVPLIVKLPKGAHGGLRVKDPVSLVDILPTMMEVVGGPTGNWDGRSLVAHWTGKKAAPRDLFSHLDVPWAKHSALVRWPFKFIQQANGKRWQYNLAVDPDEKKDIYSEKDANAVAAYRELAERGAYDVKYPPRVMSNDIPEDLREKLKNLGYL